VLIIIQSQDFFEQATGKPQPNSLGGSSAIKAMIEHFNRISNWTEETILNEERYRIRAKVLSQLIRVAKELRELNNYETLVAIISSLASPAISRLTITFAEVPPKDLRVCNTIIYLYLNVVKTLEELQILMRPDLSYKAYREALQKSVPPTILYLYDWIFCYETYILTQRCTYPRLNLL
jgi:hypothetical protein